ncbi:hypothetical protein [Zunongwangia pacifica]|uniref:Lipoprotein n=1 Tax=Zunongwangia pacifica TaxID=2911062 RepID=A0A9X1ZT04_9FLAO|nr:hypothetical protein [Zunongwangia pacifica]MCL6217148.1 hypothetical protein [Zunongwangia pacifica]
MKRIVLILACIYTLTGCSLDDDGASLSLSLAKITDAQMPDYFETGEVYNFPISYMPSNGCEEFYGFDVNREINGNVRHIYVFAVTARYLDRTDCDDPTEQEKELKNIVITGDENTEYVFHFWIGEENDEAQYLDITVPVGEPEATEE